MSARATHSQGTHELNRQIRIATMDWPFRTLSYSKPCFRLLDLPQEIRDLIYEFALTSIKSVVAFRLDEYQRPSYQEAIQPPLTRSSRQIRRESLPVFYDCNDIVLHTEGSKMQDTQRWLNCIEPRLPMLNRISLWVRYVTLTNEVSPSNGAISISMRRTKPDGMWIVDDDWQWITVTRKPSIAQRDAKFLVGELRRMLEEDAGYVGSAEGFVALMAELRMFYAKEKMS